MTKVDAFHTSTGPDGAGELKYHNQSECEHGTKIKEDGNAEPGPGEGRTLCIRCAGIARKESMGS